MKALVYEGRTDVEEGKVLVSHSLSLDEGPDAYRQFDRREDGWTKVVSHP